MAELDGSGASDEHPGVEAVLEPVDAALRERVEQPELGAGLRHRDGLEEGACVVAKPGGPREHGVPDVVGDRRPTGREDLGDEERVAGGLSVELVRVEAGRLGEPGDGLERERRHDEPLDGASGGEVADEEAKRMRPGQLVVAVRAEDEQPRSVRAARQQPHRVERRLVGPVQVLEHDDGRLARAGRVEQRSGDLMRGRASVDRLGERTAELVRDVDERAERPRGGERVAGAPRHSRHTVDLGAEGPRERRLADARFP